jgi:leader peptidase (prepilin peptidase)/N-methyltransferase
MSAAIVAACAALGALCGAFVPRLAYRLSVTYGSPPRSGCAVCGTPFPAGVAGWVRVRRRCPTCRTRLGPPAWLTVAAGALAAAVPGWAVSPLAASGGRATVAAWLVLAAFVLASAAGVLLGAIDLACLRLPDLIVGPTFAAVGVLLGAATLVAGSGPVTGQLVRAVLAALALSGGYLVLALLPGANLGLGDVKLCAPLGLLLGWLGWGAVLLGAVIPHLINGPVALALLLARRAGRRTELPLGPALLVGALLAVVGHAVVRG